MQITRREEIKPHGQNKTYRLCKQREIHLQTNTERDLVILRQGISPNIPYSRLYPLNALNDVSIDFFSVYVYEYGCLPFE